MRSMGIICIVLTLGLLTAAVPAGLAQGPDGSDLEQAAIGRTPPRLSLVDGQVSFWRPGAEDWTQAQVNTPLGPGDQLYTGSPGNLELQIGARAFVRAGANTQLGLENQEPDFLQFKVTTGYAAFDLRTVEPGRTVEVDTPNAVFTIEHAGYYRVSVAGDHTSFIARRSGRAVVTAAGGEVVEIAPSEEVVIDGAVSPQVSSYVAPQLDQWDKWNYARTEHLLDSVSARYVSPGMYGVDDLDSHGTWRVTPDYGPVWVPRGVPAGWAPYSTGSWILDPYYGWTWVDTAPWGWAPYHYGRWVSVNGYWAWAPGPVVVRPAYAPALVAFFGGPGGAVSITVGGPVVGWVALSWGEPCVPWWGPTHSRSRPWWGGWGGPRVVNNVVINKTTVVNVQEINVYHNTTVRNSVVAVHEKHFGHGPIRSVRMSRVDPKEFRPMHAAPHVTGAPTSFVPRASRGVRPPEKVLQRSVVATRPPNRQAESEFGGERRLGLAGRQEPAPRIVSAPERRDPDATGPRAPFGRSKVERPPASRGKPPSPPKFAGPARPEGVAKAAPPVARESKSPPSGPSEAPGSQQSEHAAKSAPRVTKQVKPQAEPKAASPPAAAAKPSSGRSKAQVASSTEQAPPPSVGGTKGQRTPLPGEPANRLAPKRAEKGPQQLERRETIERPREGSEKAPQGGQQHTERGKKAPAGRSNKAPEKAPQETPGG